MSSPEIIVKEIDLTTIVPAVSTTEGAIAGPFKWGPVNERTLIDSEVSLVNRHGKPTNYNAETFFVAADFLAYGRKLYVTRTVSANAYNAILATDPSSNATSNSQIISETDAAGYADDKFIARWPGDTGNALSISIVAGSADNYEYEQPYVSANTIDYVNTSALANNELTFGPITDPTQVPIVGDIITFGTKELGLQNLTVASVTTANDDVTVAFSERFRLAMEPTVSDISDLTGYTVTRRWKHYDRVSGAPQNANSFHIVVEDYTGEVTGVPGSILETWENLSVDSTAKDDTGSSVYYKTVLNQSSRWIWATDATDISLAAADRYYYCVGGTDGDGEQDMSLADYAKGYDLYKSPEEIDVSFILQGRAMGGVQSTGLANYIIDNICEIRKDCMVFVSPARADVVNNAGNILDDIVDFRNGLVSSSYAVMDSGYKYRYDKYNDLYRWVPLNGDIAGLAVRTDNTRDPWFSPAGYNRGLIKNVMKLAWNPSKAERDILYKSDINPVITQQGSGTLLFGDKTLLGRPSAFDRINVRRLFIVLEKAISRASKSYLFEFNDEFTRASFRNMIEPYLRDVQGRRGIYDFRVVCDESNNTPEIIDRNEFVGDIYIKPARSINVITLNFVAVRTGVEFTEVVGKF